MTHPHHIGIREQMEVLTADGACLGRVRDTSCADHIELGSGGTVNKDIDMSWIAWVDGTVYLSKTRDQVIASWQASSRTLSA